MTDFHQACWLFFIKPVGGYFSLLHHILILQKLEQSHEDVPILIHISGNVITHDDNLAKRIIYFLEWCQLLLTFFFRRQGIGRLDVILVEAIRGNEVNLILLVGTLAIIFYSEFTANLQQIPNRIIILIKQSQFYNIYLLY